MSLYVVEETTTLRMAVVGCDYIRNLGLAQLLNHVDFIDVLGTVPDVNALTDLVETAPVDLILMDAGITSGDLQQMCRALRNANGTPTVVVMGDLPFEVAESLIFVGVSAILHHGLIAEDLPVVLRMIHRGGALMVSDCAREALLERSSSFDINNRLRLDTLNIRERAVAQGVAEGMSNGQLATAMHVSEATVKLLVSTVMNKLGASNRVQIAVIATKAGLV